MSRIGILTFHRAHNYGAALQCYALQEILISMGHDAWVIDYRQPFIEEHYRPFILRHWLGRVFHVRPEAYYYLRDYPMRKHREEIFHSFAERHFHLTTPCSANTIPQDFDAYIIGSDQLWNPLYTGGIVDSVYIGNFTRSADSRLFGYAISSPLATFDRYGTDGLQGVVSAFDALSMREEMTARVIGCLTGITPMVCCDPVLLTNADFWNDVANSKFAGRRYILVHEVRWGDNQDLLRCKAAALAKKLNCEVIRIGVGQFSVDDFVSLFRNATYVVTSSFHATVLAIIFGRPLYAVKLNDGHDERYKNLLHTLGADALCVDTDFVPEPISIDYTPIHAALERYRAESLAFLRMVNTTDM